MLKRILIALLLVICVPLISVYTYNHINQKNDYKVKPEIVLNHSIWLVETRIGDQLEKAIREKEMNYEALLPMLTLYGSLSDAFTSMLGEDKYPKFVNGYILNDFLADQRKTPEFDWVKLERLSVLYKKLTEAQAGLFDMQNGNLNGRNMSQIKDLDIEIAALVNS